MQTVLGKKYRDKVTGFTGIATGRAEYLDQVPQVHLEPATQTKDGGQVKGAWFGESRLEDAT